MSEPEEPGDNRGRDARTGRFLPGNSANPGGRPKSRSLTSKLREIRDGGARDALAKALILKCLKGDVPALSLFLERTEGKVKDRQHKKVVIEGFLEHSYPASFVADVLGILATHGGGCAAGPGEPEPAPVVPPPADPEAGGVPGPGVP